jgi:signal transduction histidine kinase
MAPISTRQMFWLSGAFISAVLVVLVAVPLVISFQTTSILTSLSEQAEPADKLGADIQSALSHEVSAIVGFQATGEETYADLCRQQSENIGRDLALLERMGNQVPVREHAEEIRRAVDRWHEYVQSKELLTQQLPPGAFRRLLFDHDYLYEAAHQATTNLNQGVSAWRNTQRSKVQNLTQLTTTLSVVFAFLAVAAVVMVVTILRRLNDTASYLENAIRGRDEVLRVVSHDLRNPLHNIQMTTRVMAGSALGQEQHERMVQIIMRATGRMNRLIEDLLAAARLREGQAIPLELRPEDPGEILDEACEIFEVQAQTRSIQLRREKDSPLPPANIDRHRILQVLSNLIDNAIKFTPEGGTLTVRCQVDRARPGKLLVSVADTGRGIERQNLDKIFDMFWQVKSTAHMGTGLGLAIAKAIVEGHGGKIWAESKPGAGTTFFLTLPLKEVPLKEGQVT